MSAGKFMVNMLILWLGFVSGINLVTGNRYAFSALLIAGVAGALLMAAVGESK